MLKRTTALLFILWAASGVGAQEMPILTVLDLKVDQVSENEMRTVISLLSSALFQTKQYTVIDVSERDSLLKEIEFSVADCSDEACALEIGKLLAAEYIVVGLFSKLGSKFVLSVKLLETSTSRTVSTADGIYAELEDILDDVQRIAKRLAGVEEVAEAAPEATAAADETPTTEDSPVEEKSAPAEEASAAADTPAAEEEPVAEATLGADEAQEGPVADESPPISPAPPERPPREPVPVLRVAAIGSAVGAVVALGVGGYFAVTAVQYLSGPVEAAYQTYLIEPQGSSLISTLYDNYRAEWDVYGRMILPGAVLGGAGVLLGGASVVLFVISSKDDETTIPQVSLVAGPAGIGVGVRS